VTPLERLIDDRVTAFRVREWYAQAEFEKKARAVIKAMAESRRRSISQLCRFAAARIAAQQGGVR